MRGSLVSGPQRDNDETASVPQSRLVWQLDEGREPSNPNDLQERPRACLVAKPSAKHWPPIPRIHGLALIGYSNFHLAKPGSIPDAAMASQTDPIQALKESKPPATDPITYLTIVGEFMSPEILPTLNELLQDAQLAQEIGWNLVSLLVPVEGSEECLKTVAQLGNPREVILTVHEALEMSVEDPAEAANEAARTNRFITLLGMLGILHKRLQFKHASRFVHTTLQAVYRAYEPGNPEMTAAVIALVRSLSVEKRPPLPTRQSSTSLNTPFKDTDQAEHAPDPEGKESERPAPSEPEMIRRLLQSFITCIIEAYVNTASLQWSARLLEFYNPERIVLRKSVMRAFKEQDELLQRDALIGALSVGCLDRLAFSDDHTNKG